MKRRNGSAGHVGKSKPAEIIKAETTFFKCPKGHKLPHHTNKGQCTPIHCYGSAKAPEGDTAYIARKSADKTPEEVEDDERTRVARAASRYRARQEFLAVPENLGGAEAEEWTDRKLVSLLPIAAAEVEFKLKYGDDDERERAARVVMDSTGRGKREMSGGATQPIIMLVGANSTAQTLPWVQRVEVQEKRDAPKTLGSVEVPTKAPGSS